MSDKYTLPQRDSIRGNIRADGSFVGFDYRDQNWIDTDPRCVRDPNARPGSASNPLPACPQDRGE